MLRCHSPSLSHTFALSLSLCQTQGGGLQKALSVGRSVCLSVGLAFPPRPFRFQPAGGVWHNQGTWSCISYRHMAQSISHKTRLFHLRLQITIIKWNNLGKLYIFWIHRVMSVFQLLWFVSVICLDATRLNENILVWRKWWKNVCYLKFEDLQWPLYVS